MKKEIVAIKGEWKIQRDEFRDALRVAFIVDIEGIKHVIIALPTSWKQLSEFTGLTTCRNAIILTNTQLDLLEKAGKTNGKWEYLVNDRTKLKYEVLPLSLALREAWDTLLTERQLVYVGEQHETDNKS